MSAVDVLPVRTARERRIFLTFPWRIYRGDPLWVPPLLPQRAATIDPRRGAFFERGEAAFFIAWMDGQPAGTICAAEDRPANAFRQVRECMFGFFECIEEYDVAQALFHCAMRWAEQRGLNTLYGPFNLDYEDSYGILIEGRDRPPALLCGHTPPYYQGLVERFGFQRARGDNLAYAVDLGEDTPALRRLARLADALRRRGQILVRGADLAHWDDEMDRVHRLLNAALAHIPDHIPWRREVLQAMLEPFRAIVDPELILFAEVNGEVVGWFPGIANLNQVLQRANGLRYPWDYVRLWWAANSCILHWDNARMPGPMPFARRRQPECLAIKSVLVLPEYWDTGVSVLLFDEMRRRAQARGFKWVDLSLTSDDNPYTPALAEHMGARIYKRYRVYRLRFSE